jgi:hypothetical protein
MQVYMTDISGGPLCWFRYTLEVYMRQLLAGLSDLLQGLLTSPFNSVEKNHARNFTVLVPRIGVMPLARFQCGWLSIYGRFNTET